MDFFGALDPALREILPSLAPLDLTDIPAARATREQRVRASLARSAPRPSVIVTDYEAPPRLGHPGVRLRAFHPRGVTGPLPCLYWIHGGGHVVGFLDQDGPRIRQLVDAVGCVVVAVDWRKSPEHPFPAEIQDCHAGLIWTVENAEKLGIDAERVAVGGSSSGAGSAAGLALLTRDRGDVSLCFQLLLYPMLDDRNVTPSSHAITDQRVWNRHSNLLAWRAYLGPNTGTDAVSPYAAPTRATDLSGLPPAYIPVGSVDLFLDESLEYGQRLLRAGVLTEMHVYPGGIHGFDVLAPDSPLARRFTRDRDEALHRALFDTPPRDVDQPGPSTREIDTSL